MPYGIYTRTNWHNNINATSHTGLKQSQTTVQKRRQALLGRIRPPEEIRKTIEGLKQHYINNPNKFSGTNNPFYGKHHTPEAKQKIGQAHQNITMPSTTGANHWNWKGGIAQVPYAYEFNNILKDLIRERDHLTCQICGITQETHLQIYKAKLEIHHIDEDKHNNSPTNLIALCKKCHSAIIQPCENIAEFIYKHKLQEHLIHVSVDGVLVNKEVKL